jgi:hypothetical protein
MGCRKGNLTGSRIIFSVGNADKVSGSIQIPELFILVAKLYLMMYNADVYITLWLEESA